MLGEIRYTPGNKPTPEELEKMRATKKVHPADEVTEAEKSKKAKDRKEGGKGENIDIEA